MNSITPTRPLLTGRSGPLAALDIGAHKIACFIGRADENGRLRVIGVGQHRSQGVNQGAIVDMDAAEQAIRAAVDGAEQMADERIDHVVVNVTGGQPRSGRIEVDVAVDGHQVGEPDMRRIESCIRRHTLSDGRDLLHAIHVAYSVDGSGGVRDPRGMVAERLGVTIHQVSATANVLRNLETVVRRCELEPEEWVITPYASALGCLTEDAKALGVVCVDMGAASTSIAVIQDGAFVHMGVIPVGGRHVTNDIAHCLSTPLDNAERLKILHGNAMPASVDKRETLKVPLIGEGEDGKCHVVPRSMLNQIIQPRIEETLELVRAHLEAAGFSNSAGRLLVLTGGASQLQGLRDAAALILDRQVRVASPIHAKGMAEAVGGPAFSTSIGLLKYAALARAKRPAPRAEQTDRAASPWSRIGRWLQENF